MLPEAIVALDTACSNQIDLWVQDQLINKRHENHVNWKPRSKQAVDFLISSGIRGACLIHDLRRDVSFVLVVLVVQSSSQANAIRLSLFYLFFIYLK